MLRKGIGVGPQAKSEYLAQTRDRYVRPLPQIDFKAGFISLHASETKNQEARTFPLTDELRAVLEQQRRYTDQVQRKLSIIVPHVFHREGRPIRGFRKAWATACYKAGLPCEIETTPAGRVRVVKAHNLLHDFRRTAVRNLVRAGVPERVAMRLTGHETRSVFERYNIVSLGDLMAAGHRLNDFYRAMGTIKAQRAVALPQVTENTSSPR